jgi:hypothetical protein
VEATSPNTSPPPLQLRALGVLAIIFSSVLLGIFSSILANYALRNGSETLQERLEVR